MTVGRYLVLFPGEEGGWLRIAEGGVEARGEPSDLPLPLDREEDSETVVLVLPGTEVTIRWLDLPDNLSVAQAFAAARLLASEIVAEPIDTMHLALGPPEENKRCMALVTRSVIERALANAEAIGLEVDHIVSGPLLIAPPRDGARVFKRSGIDNVRCPDRAFAAEPDLASLLLENEAIETIDQAEFEAGLPGVLDALPVDLRQGEFAKPRRWKADAGFIRRLAMLAGAILLVTLAIQLTLIMRYSFAADAIELETADIAREALPGVTEISDPRAQLQARLADLGGGRGYSGLASPIFLAVRDTAGAELQSLTYSSAGGAQISVAVESEQSAARFEQNLVVSGLTIIPGRIRNSGGRRIADYVVSAR